MIADFRAQGIRTILITDLHIKKDPNHGYAPYDSGMKNDVFVKNPDGSVYVGVVWPGAVCFLILLCQVCGTGGAGSTKTSSGMGRRASGMI